MRGTMAIKVLLVDDNALFRDGIGQILRADGRFEVIGQASQGGEAASQLAQGKRAMVLVSDGDTAKGDGARSSDLLGRLTERELEVLRALSTGANTAEIAHDLGITMKTLRNHISNTYHKLGIYDR